MRTPPVLGPHFRVRRWFGLTLNDVAWIRDHLDSNDTLSPQLTYGFWHGCITDNTAHECNKFLEGHRPADRGEGLKDALLRFLEN